MLKDENYRIREEQLRLEKELKVSPDPGHRPWAMGGHGLPRVATGDQGSFKRIDAEWYKTSLEQLS